MDRRFWIQAGTKLIIVNLLLFLSNVTICFLINYGLCTTYFLQNIYTFNIIVNFVYHLSGWFTLVQQGTHQQN